MIGNLGQMAISGEKNPFHFRSECDGIRRLRKEAAQDRELKRSNRSRAPPERFIKSYSHDVQSTIAKFFIVPENFENAINSEQKDNIEANTTDIEKLNETENWDIVPKEKEENISPGRRVYKIKFDSNRNINRFKALFVAKSFKQIEGIEYSDTLLSLANLNALKIY